MRQISQPGAGPQRAGGLKPLPEQIAEAVRSESTPLSQLLRLMFALDAEGGDEALRGQLRARIGAPLDS